MTWWILLGVGIFLLVPLSGVLWRISPTGRGEARNQRIARLEREIEILDLEIERDA